MGIQMMGGNPLESFQTGYNLGNKPNAIGTAILGVMERYQQKQLEDRTMNQFKAQEMFKNDLEIQKEAAKVKAKYKAFQDYSGGNGGGTPISQTNIPGQPGGGGPKPSMWTMRPDGEVVENPEYKSYQENQKEENKIKNKPYSAEEIKIVSGLDLIPQVDKLIKLAEDKQVYGPQKGGMSMDVPFGASRISAFGEAGPWQAIKRGFTAGPGREAGLILQDIKQILFATGGQALTDPEIVKLAPKLNPAYKTEDQWIADLKDVRQRIINKAEALRNPDAFSRYDNNDLGRLGLDPDKYEIIGVE